ncbi:cytochrome C oxidase subunit IV family protein [Thiobacillus sp.]|uniref:cytochrome C oxidase subunit IV family protein n=1 Tax=Thiobacillus sp. TaxID=924 RepID=UPI0025E5B481|nr:cytochrome C oxidase subunit IV family protein [Thiobacillus sp.]MBT9539082.1 cytochrome C oxidase subunit IV family protein [Thiobacillus sp.]
MKQATLLWLLLLALTTLTTQAATLSAAAGLTGSAVPLVLLAALIKGRVVIDRFMVLQHVDGPWRWIVLGWLLLVLGLIGYAFNLNPT